MCFSCSSANKRIKIGTQGLDILNRFRWSTFKIDKVFRPPTARQLHIRNPLEGFSCNFGSTRIDVIKLSNKIIQKMQSNSNEIIRWLKASPSSSTASSKVVKSLSAASVQLQSEGILEEVDELFEALNH